MTEFEAQLAEKVKNLSTQELLDMYREGTLTVESFRVLLDELQTRGVTAAQLDDPDFNPERSQPAATEKSRLPVAIGWIVGVLVLAGAVLYFLL